MEFVDGLEIAKLMLGFSKTFPEVECPGVLFDGSLSKRNKRNALIKLMGKLRISHSFTR